MSPTSTLKSRGLRPPESPRRSGTSWRSSPCSRDPRAGLPTWCRSSFRGCGWGQSRGSDTAAAAAATATGGSDTRQRWAGPCAQNKRARWWTADGKLTDSLNSDGNQSSLKPGK